MKTFHVKTLGCKTNRTESEIITENLESYGFCKAEKPDEADLYVLNSCAVTETAARESLYFLKNIKNKHPQITTVLTGCVAQIEAEKMKYEASIDFIVGNNEKLSLGEYLKRNRKYCVDDIFTLKKFNNKQVHAISRTRANLKIQDGCNNRCTYCTIPYARGNARSNPTGNVIEQINIFVQNGIKEIILTGIHIGQWGGEFSPKLSLIDLLKEIEKTPIARYRLGSLEPSEIDDELVEFLAKSKKFCPHFHISIQSMNDKTLSEMNRHYTADDVLKKIKKLNSKFELPFLGCDIIVGFPGETEDDFEIMYNNLDLAELSQIHVFPYSIRNNTPAAAMKNQTAENIKKERAHKIKQLSERKFTVFLGKNLNTIHEVQIQKTKKGNFYKGLTKNYIDVLIPSPKDISNELVSVKIDKINNDVACATLI